MRLIKVKTVRFTELVRACGQPEPYTAWADPLHDLVFQKAVRETRVLTVHQETAGTRSDYGSIGYTRDRHGSLLIFPKSLHGWRDRRVVGVKYDLLATPPTSVVAPAKVSHLPVKRAAKKVAEPDHAEKRRAAFKVFEPEPRASAVEKARAPKRAEAERLRDGIQQALAALADDQPLTALRILRALVE